MAKANRCKLINILYFIEKKNAKEKRHEDEKGLAPHQEPLHGIGTSNSSQSKRKEVISQNTEFLPSRREALCIGYISLPITHMSLIPLNNSFPMTSRK